MCCEWGASVSITMETDTAVRHSTHLNTRSLRHDENHEALCSVFVSYMYCDGASVDGPILVMPAAVTAIVPHCLPSLVNFVTERCGCKYTHYTRMASVYRHSVIP